MVALYLLADSVLLAYLAMVLKKYSNITSPSLGSTLTIQFAQPKNAYLGQGVGCDLAMPTCIIDIQSFVHTNLTLA